MRLELTPEQQSLRKELRAYFAAMMTPEVEEEMSRHEMGGPLSKKLAQQMGADGWLGHRLAQGVRRPGPVADRAAHLLRRGRSGPGRRSRCSRSTPSARRSCASAPTSRSSASSPGSCAASSHFAIGYTEPGSGTDLASLQHAGRARRRRVRGQRAEGVHEPRRPRRLRVARGAHRPRRAQAQGHLDHHRADVRLPASRCSPIHIVGGGKTNATFYDDVRVPVDNRVGGENEGWKLITTQLNHERVALCNAGTIYRHLEEVQQLGEGDDARRRVAGDRPGVGAASTWPGSRPAAEFLRLMNWKVAWGLSDGGLDPG